MPRIATVLEAHVPRERQADLEAAYRAAATDTLPAGLVRSNLLHSNTDPTLWRIETVWESREHLAAMRGQGTPRGVLIFRAAEVEPTLAIFEIADELGQSSQSAD